jgi:hypothetical protein
LCSHATEVLMTTSRRILQEKTSTGPAWFLIPAKVVLGE